MEIMSLKVTIYTDGGARGNPGPAAIGVGINYAGDIKKNGEYIGAATNKEAEYRAVIFALKKLKQLVGKKKAKSEAEVELRLDSELLASQLNGEYKIREKNLQQFFLEIWNLKQDFRAVIFKYIPR